MEKLATRNRSARKSPSRTNPAQTNPALAPSLTQSPAALGARVRDIRKRRGWTIADLAGRTGLAISTISKMERGTISLTYDRFMRLAKGLGLDVGELFDAEAESFGRGSVSVTRAGEAPVHETPTYVYEMLASELSGKHMVPMTGRIKARSAGEFTDFVSHPGEEFVYVVSGLLELRIGGREPIVLGAGDSAYFDSGLNHIYVTAGESDVELVVVCWKPGR